MKSQRREIMRARVARRTLRVVVAVLLLVSLAHLLRLLSGTEIIIGGKLVPLWTSLPGLVGPALLAFLLWWSRGK